MSFPLGIIGGGFGDVADGDTLNIGLLQKFNHDAQTLRTDTDEAEIDFVAGRDVTGSAQNVSGNDGKSDCRGGGLSQKLAPRKRIRQKVLRPEPILHDASGTP